MHQIKLDRQKNSAEIDLNAFFYPKHILEQATVPFRKIAEITLKEEKGRHCVLVKPKEKGKAEKTALHFCNYALSLKRELGEHA